MHKPGATTLREFLSACHIVDCHHVCSESRSLRPFLFRCTSSRMFRTLDFASMRRLRKPASLHQNINPFVYGQSHGPGRHQRRIGDMAVEAKAPSFQSTLGWLHNLMRNCGTDGFGENGDRYHTRYRFITAQIGIASSTRLSVTREVSQTLTQAITLPKQVMQCTSTYVHSKKIIKYSILWSQSQNQEGLTSPVFAFIPVPALVIAALPQTFNRNSFGM